MCELADRCRGEFVQRGGEAFGIDCGAVIETDAQCRPVRSGHVWLGGFVERMTCLVDGLGECFGSGPIPIADVGWPSLRGGGLSCRKTFETPAQSFGKLFQRFDLHEDNRTTAERLASFERIGNSVAALGRRLADRFGNNDGHGERGVCIRC